MREADAKHAQLAVATSWVVGDKVVVNEEAQFEVHPATEDGRAIDLVLKWTTTDEPVTLRGAEGKSYGGLVLRFAPRRTTVITVPSGRTTEDLVMTKLPWADLSGDFDGTGGRGLSGAAVFVHPGHVGAPLEWMTRAYGALAVGWPGVEPVTLPAGTTATCRYRVFVHRGVPDSAEEISKSYDAYLASPQGALGSSE